MLTYRINLNTEARDLYTMSTIEYLLIAAILIASIGAGTHICMM